MMTIYDIFISKKYFLMFFLFCLAFSLCFLSPSYADESPGVTDKSVKIGFMADLTGPTAEGWIQIADGAKAILNMVNEKGGIHGRKIDYIIEDDRYSIPMALSSFKKLIYKDRIFALQAASGVGHTAAIIPLVEKEGIPHIAASTEQKFFVPARKYIFSPMPWYQDQAALVIEYIFKDLKVPNPTIALMYPDTASGKDCRDAVRKLVKVYPVKKYKEVGFSITSMDFTSEVLALKRHNPDIIFIHGLVIDTSSIVKSAYRLKLSIPIIVDQYGCSDEVLAITGKAAERLLAINCHGTWDDDLPGVNILRKAAMEYNPKMSRRSAYFFAGWFVGMLFCEGFKNAGRDLTRESFLKGLEVIKDFDTQGICGIVTFGPDDHKAVDTHRFYKADIDKKRFVPISGWRKPSQVE